MIYNSSSEMFFLQYSIQVLYKPGIKKQSGRCKTKLNIY